MRLLVVQTLEASLCHQHQDPAHPGKDRGQAQGAILRVEGRIPLRELLRRGMRPSRNTSFRYRPGCCAGRGDAGAYRDGPGRSLQRCRNSIGPSPAIIREA